MALDRHGLLVVHAQCAMRHAIVVLYIMHLAGQGFVSGGSVLKCFRPRALPNA